METQKQVEEFFKRRFPKKDIEFEKERGYFGEWVERFKTGEPEGFMDSESLRVYIEMLEEEVKRLKGVSN